MSIRVRFACTSTRVPGRSWLVGRVRTLGDVETFDTLLRRNPDHPLGFWKIWYFGRIPWQRRTVTPASVFESRELRVVVDTRGRDPGARELRGSEEAETGGASDC